MLVFTQTVTYVPTIAFQIKCSPPLDIFTHMLSNNPKDIPSITVFTMLSINVSFSQIRQHW